MERLFDSIEGIVLGIYVPFQSTFSNIVGYCRRSKETPPPAGQRPGGASGRRSAASRRWCALEAALSTVVLMNAILAIFSFGLTLSNYFLYLPAVSCITIAAWTGVEAVTSFETRSASETSGVDRGRRTDSRGLRGVDLFEYDDVISTALATSRVISVFAWFHLFLVGAILIVFNLAAIADNLPDSRHVKIVVPIRFCHLWLVWLAIRLFEKCRGYSVFGVFRERCSSQPGLVMVIGFVLRAISLYFWLHSLWLIALLTVSIMEHMTPRNLPRYILPRVLGFLWLAVKALKKCGGYVMFWKVAERCRTQPRCKPVRALVMVGGLMYALLLYLFPLPFRWRWSLIATHTVRSLNVLSSLRRENEGANVRGIFGVGSAAEGVKLPI